MPEAAGAAERDALGERVAALAPGLSPLVARAEQVQQDRAATAAEDARQRGAPRWTDVFTTQFTEFSNRPR